MKQKIFGTFVLWAWVAFLLNAGQAWSAPWNWVLVIAGMLALGFTLVLVSGEGLSKEFPWLTGGTGFLTILGLWIVFDIWIKPHLSPYWSLLLPLLLVLAAFGLSKLWPTYEPQGKPIDLSGPADSEPARTTSCSVSPERPLHHKTQARHEKAMERSDWKKPMVILLTVCCWTAFFLNLSEPWPFLQGILLLGAGGAMLVCTLELLIPEGMAKKVGSTRAWRVGLNALVLLVFFLTWVNPHVPPYWSLLLPLVLVGVVFGVSRLWADLRPEHMKKREPIPQ